MVARLVRDQEVVGSSPVTSTISSVHNRPKGLVWTLDCFLPETGLERVGSRIVSENQYYRKNNATKQQTELLFATQA